MPAPLRIAMFCPQFRPAIGGAERQAERLATALAAAGHRLTIVTPRLDPASPARETHGGLAIERFVLDDLSRRVPRRGIAALNVPYVLAQITRALAPRLRGIDVLHCHIASLETACAALAARAAGVPVLCKAAVADERSDLGELERTGPSGAAVAWLTRRLVDTWVATTGAVEEALVRAGVARARIARIPNGVAAPAASPAAGRPVRRFLYLGRVAANAGRDVAALIAAFDRIAAARPELELAIVGDGDQLDDMRARARACAARDRIQLPGLGDAARWLAWADGFVLPSRREGLSNALLEAMAAGLPCIANDIPPNREVLDDGRAGVLVPVADVAAMAGAMAALADHGGAPWAEAARRRVRACYAIDAIAARYVVLYRDLRREAVA